MSVTAAALVTGRYGARYSLFTDSVLSAIPTFGKLTRKRYPESGIDRGGRKAGRPTRLSGSTVHYGSEYRG